MGRSGTGQPIPGVEAAWGGASAEIGAAVEGLQSSGERESMRETEKPWRREEERRRCTGLAWATPWLGSPAAAFSVEDDAGRRGTPPLELGNDGTRGAGELGRAAARGLPPGPDLARDGPVAGREVGGGWGAGSQATWRAPVGPGGGWRRRAQWRLAKWRAGAGGARKWRGAAVLMIGLRGKQGGRKGKAKIGRGDIYI